MRFLYHHRTRGQGVEGVHIRGIAEALLQIGHEVSIVGPPGVDLPIGPHPNPDTNLGSRRRSADQGSTWKGRLWDGFARRCPGALFELFEAGYTLAALPRLHAACRRIRPDAIYERYAFFNTAGLFAARARGLPLLLEVNDTVAVERERRGKSLVLGGVARRIEDRVFAGATALFVVSGYLRELLLRRGIPEERIVVAPNAVDPRRFHPEQAAAADIRERLGFGSRVVIGFVGSFLSWHGIEFLMRVMPRVLERHPRAAFLLVGDGGRRAGAEEAIAARGLSQRVRFTGQVPHDRVPEYVAAMDVGLMPHSNRFGSPVKIYEYMAMGVVPVGPRLGPLEEAIEDGATGLLFTPRDEVALGAVLDRLIEHEGLRRQLGAAARRKVLDCHLWTHNARTIETTLLRLAPPRLMECSD